MKKSKPFNYHIGFSLFIFGVMQTVLWQIAVTPVSASVPTCDSDVDQNNRVDLTDYSILVSNFLVNPPTNSNADIDHNGSVDLKDYSLLVNAFLKPCLPSNVTATQSPTGTPANSLPAQVLNLTNWKLQLPISTPGNVTEVKQTPLATYQINPWFLVNQQGTGVLFRAAVNGVTTPGSTYPRSELREMTTNGTVNANWSTTVGTHTLFLDEAITAVPQTKKHVVAGQIHDGTSDVIVVRLEYPKLFVKIGNTTGPTLDANYTLGKRFTVKFEVSNDQTKLYYNGSPTPTYTLDRSYSGYFKAGAYTQSNCTTEGLATLCTNNNYGEVVVYQAIITHQ